MQSVYVRQNCGKGFSISVLRSHNPSKRKICIMTHVSASDFLRSHISDHVINNMPPSFQASFTSDSFSFMTGKVNRLASARGTGDTDLDQICEPRNPFYYSEPRMGDSVGIALDQGDDRNASILGPCLSIEDRNFWLMNFHPFEMAEVERGKYTTSSRLKEITVEHPSPMDRLSCLRSKHKHWLQDKDFTLGKVEYHSGPAYKTTRWSREPYWQEAFHYGPRSSQIGRSAEQRVLGSMSFVSHQEQHPVTKDRSKISATSYPTHESAVLGEPAGFSMESYAEFQHM